MSICVVQTRPGIGDMCVFLPYIHLIAKNRKEKVTIITKERSRAKDFLQYDPNILKIIYIDENNKKKSKIDILKILLKEKFSEIYILQFDLKFFFLSKLARIKKIYKYGFIKKDVSITEFIYKKTCEWLNCKQIKPECKIYLNSITSKDKKIVIGIGGSGKNKKWPINNFVNLILSLKKIYPGYKYIIAGGEEESDESNEIYQIAGPGTVSLCKMSIKESLDEISGASFYVGNDTGFMHLCGSIGIKSFGLFGDTPINYVSYNKLILPIMPRGKTVITHEDQSMHLITVEHVIYIIKKNLVF